MTENTELLTGVYLSSLDTGSMLRRGVVTIRSNTWNEIKYAFQVTRAGVPRLP